MSGNNLFVLKNGMIAFSRHLYRDNRTLVAIPLSEMINLETGRISFPISTQGSTLTHSSDNGLGKELDDTLGPIMVTFGPFGDICELYRLTAGVEFTSFRAQEDTVFSSAGSFYEEQFYVRSAQWSIEVAANTAAMIYNDVEKIFEEAYYSAGFTPPPYFVASVKNLKSALTNISTVVEMAIEKHLDPEFKPLSPENIDRIYKKYVNNSQALLEDLKLVYSTPALKHVVYDMVRSLMVLEPINNLFEPETKEPQDVHQERTGIAKKRDARPVQKPGHRRSKTSS